MNSGKQFAIDDNKYFCHKLILKYPDHLLKSNYLSEFSTEEDKRLVLSNLGILDLINSLEERINILENGSN